MIRSRNLPCRAILLAALLLAATLAAQTKPEPIPPLKPPKPVIAPTVWEEHRTSISLGSIAACFGIAGVVWLALRKRTAATEPPAQKALRQLEELARTPQQPLALTRVSRTVREYITSAFSMPPGETTTTEFLAQIRQQPDLGEDLAARLPEFLRACDERKFSPTPPPGEFDAIPRARALIATGESRLTTLAARAAEAKKQSA